MNNESSIPLTIELFIHCEQEPLAQLAGAVFDLLNKPDFECLDDVAKAEVLMFVVRARGGNV